MRAGGLPQVASETSPVTASVVAGSLETLPGSRIFISPRARQLAEEKQCDWRQLQGTGPEGAIVERDVLAFLAKPPAVISPLAKRMAEQTGLDWTRISGSGAGGKVVSADVSQALAPVRDNTTGQGSEAESGANASAGSSEGDAPEAKEEVLQRIPVSGVRSLIASRMMQSAATTAPVTLTSETDATELVLLRSRLQADGITASYNDLLLKILAKALTEHPHMNASWKGDSIYVWKRIHIGLAVDSQSGLRVPVVRDVDKKGLSEIAAESSRLAEAARLGNLAPDAMQGGTFTLSNLGMFGIDAFTPVIHLPESAILGVGRIKARPSVVDDQVAVRRMMWLSLTFDHRLVDGGPAARFLQRVAQLVEKPHLLLG